MVVPVHTHASFLRVAWAPDGFCLQGQTRRRPSWNKSKNVSKHFIRPSWQGMCVESCPLASNIKSMVASTSQS